MIAALLARLAKAAQHPIPAVRVLGYGLAVAGVSRSELTRLVSVLTEGAMRGPDAARSMAAELGG